MQKLTVAIVDASGPDLEKLCCLAEEVMPGCQLSCFYSLQSFAMQENVYDLVLLDVLTGGHTSIAFEEQIARKAGCILYTGTSLNMMEFAFHPKAAGFLVKTDPDVKNLAKMASVLRRLPKTIHVDTNCGPAWIPENRIIFAEKQGSYILLHLTAHRTLASRMMTLKELNEQTGNRLAQADRKTLINPCHIRKIHHHTVYLTEETEIRPSRRQLENIKELFLRGIML